MSEPLYFYQQSGNWGIFSNFSRHKVTIDGKIWPTNEHYFQAMKFKGTPHEERIRKAKTAWEAKKLGNTHALYKDSNRLGKRKGKNHV